MKNKVYEVKEKVIEDTWQNQVIEITKQYDLELPRSIKEHLQLQENDGVFFILKNDCVEIRKDKSE